MLQEQARTKLQKDTKTSDTALASDMQLAQKRWYCSGGRCRNLVRSVMSNAESSINKAGGHGGITPDPSHSNVAKTLTSYQQAATDSDSAEQDQPQKRKANPGSIAALKSALESKMGGDNQAQMIELHIAANTSASKFNAIAARQLELSEAQTEITNHQREVELELARENMLSRKEEVKVANARLELDSKRSQVFLGSAS